MNATRTQNSMKSSERRAKLKIRINKYMSISFQFKRRLLKNLVENDKDNRVFLSRAYGLAD